MLQAIVDEAIQARRNAHFPLCDKGESSLHRTMPPASCQKRKAGRTNYPPSSQRGLALLHLKDLCNASCVNPGLFKLK